MVPLPKPRPSYSRYGRPAGNAGIGVEGCAQASSVTSSCISKPTREARALKTDGNIWFRCHDTFCSMSYSTVRCVASVQDASIVYTISVALADPTALQLMYNITLISFAMNYSNVSVLVRYISNLSKHNSCYLALALH